MPNAANVYCATPRVDAPTIDATSAPSWKPESMMYLANLGNLGSTVVLAIRTYYSPNKLYLDVFDNWLFAYRNAHKRLKKSKLLAYQLVLNTKHYQSINL